MYSLRSFRGMLFVSMIVLYNLCRICLVQLTSVRFSAFDTPRTVNASVMANGLQMVLVIPRNQENIEQIQQTLGSTIIDGHAKIVESRYVSGYQGVLFWSVKAEEFEIEKMTQQLGDLVSTCQPSASYVDA